jgi:hypothetical protein
MATQPGRLNWHPYCRDNFNCLYATGFTSSPQNSARKACINRMHVSVLMVTMNGPNIPLVLALMQISIAHLLYIMFLGCIEQHFKNLLFDMKGFWNLKGRELMKDNNWKM